MKRYFLLTAFGKDRPGIVAGVTRALFESGGNIEDATMTRLGGEFTMMLVSALPSQAAIASLKKKLAPLERKLGLELQVKPLQGLAHRTKEPQARYLISVYGTDRPGIVYRVAQALADRKVNITDLQTKILPGKSPVYVMLLEIQAPASPDLDELRSKLDALRQELCVEISLQDIEAVPL
jgi:glycine cleavage system transcriptional repressor